MEKDLPYVDSGDDAQRLDLYLPSQPPEKPLPLIVHIHGGGWRGGNKFPCPVVGMALRGYGVASVEYRFSQKALFPAQIQDCQAAIRWLKANAAGYGLDASRVGVIGASAGGHLCALVGTSGGKGVFPVIGGNPGESDRVQAVCDIYGPTDFSTVVQQAADDPNVRNIFRFNAPSDPYSSLIGVSLDHRDKTVSVSPVTYVTSDTPPFLILHGTHDALVPLAQSEELLQVLQQKGVRSWLQRLPGSGHGGAAFTRPQILKLTFDFFERHLKGADVVLETVPERELAVDPPSAGSK